MNLRTWPLLLVVIASVAGLAYLGRFRPTPPDRPRDFDTFYLYAGGFTWLTGENPYDYPTFERRREQVGDVIFCSFAYAPTVALPAVAISNLSTESWTNVLAALNVVAAVLAGVCLGVVSIGGQKAKAGLSFLSAAFLWPILLFTASPASVANLHAGQSSLIATALALGSFVALQRQRDWLAGALLALATFKISLVAGVVVWAVVWSIARRRISVLVVALLVAAALAAPAFVQGGLRESTLGWLQALSEYRGFPQNHPANVNSYGAYSLLWRAELPWQWTPALALAGLVWLWFRRSDATPFEQFAVALALPTLFFLAHVYDASALAPLSLATILASRNRGIVSLAIGLAIFSLMPATVAGALGKSMGALATLVLLIVAVELRRIRPLPLTVSASVQEDGKE